MSFYVKKIWSLKPVKYKYLPFPTAMKQYEEWSTCTLKKTKDINKLKTFEEWLKTEN